MFHLVILNLWINNSESLASKLCISFSNSHHFSWIKCKKQELLSQKYKKRAHPQKGRAQINEIVNLSAIIQLLLARS